MFDLSYLWNSSSYPFTLNDRVIENSSPPWIPIITLQICTGIHQMFEKIERSACVLKDIISLINKENFLCLFYGQKKNVLNNRKLFCFIHVYCITFNFGSRKIYHEFVYTLNFNHVDCKTFLKMIYLMFNSGSLHIVQVI